MLTKAAQAMPQVSGRGGVNIEDSGKFNCEFAKIHLKNKEVIETEFERIALFWPISADGDDAAVVMTDHMAGTAVTTRAWAPDPVDNPAGRSQIRRRDQPFVFESSLPLQPFGREARNGLKRRP